MFNKTINITFDYQTEKKINVVCSTGMTFRQLIEKLNLRLNDFGISNDIKKRKMIDQNGYNINKEEIYSKTLYELGINQNIRIYIPS